MSTISGQFQDTFEISGISGQLGPMFFSQTTLTEHIDRPARKHLRGNGRPTRYQEQILGSIEVAEIHGHISSQQAAILYRLQHIKHAM